MSTQSGPIRLWQARSKDGSIRFRFVEIPAHGLPEGPLTGILDTSSGPKLDAAVETPDNWPTLPAPIVHGQVNPPVTAVSIRYPDGHIQRVRLLERAFLVVLDHGTGPVTIEARDATGKLVARQSLTLDPAATPKVTETGRLITVAIPNGSASPFVDPGPNPPRCARVVAPNGETTGCVGTPPQKLDYGFMQSGEGSTAVALLFGSVAPDIVKVRMLLPHRWIELPLHEGFFLYGLAPADQPRRIETTSRSGVVTTTVPPTAALR